MKRLNAFRLGAGQRIVASAGCGGPRVAFRHRREAGLRESPDPIQKRTRRAKDGEIERCGEGEGGRRRRRRRSMKLRAVSGEFPPSTRQSSQAGGYMDGTYICGVWVGIDGTSGSTDVLQAGTGSQ